MQSSATPCLLFHPEGGTADSTAWTATGVTDMHHLSEKIKKHELSKTHMDSCLRLSALGRVNIATQLDEGYRLAVRRHNDEVSVDNHKFTGELRPSRDFGQGGYGIIKAVYSEVKISGIACTDPFVI